MKHSDNLAKYRIKQTAVVKLMEPPPPPTKKKYIILLNSSRTAFFPQCNMHTYYFPPLDNRIFH